MKVVLLLAFAMCLLVSLPVWATSAQIQITVDNVYWLWLNPGVLAGDGTLDPGYVGSQAPNDWMTVETFDLAFREGQSNTILVKGMNVVGETPYGNGAPAWDNPSGLIAKIVVDGKTVDVSNSSWEYSLDENPTVSGTWHAPSVEIAPWHGTWIWNGIGIPGLIDAFSNTDAKWIWSETYPTLPDGQSITVWFRTTIPAVPVQWKVADGGNGHWYEVVTVPAGITWYDARDMAATKGGYLAAITSAAENAFLVGLNPTASSYWAGGSQPAGSVEPAGNWQWVTGEQWNYANWAAGEPNNTYNDEDCLEWRREGNWNDRNHATLMTGYIVEYEHVPVQWKVEDGGNGHWYEVVPVPERITWVDARDAAYARGGYLATPTSAAENEFIFNLAKDVDAVWYPIPAYNTTLGPWLGGYQDRSAPDYSEPGGGWRWITGEPFVFQTWYHNQPGNADEREDHLHYAGWDLIRASTWNDVYGGSPMWGYVVEYSTVPNPDTYTVSGGVTLEDFKGNASSIPLILEFRADTTRTEIVNLSTAGDFTIAHVAPGTYDIYIKASHWLAKVQYGVSVSADVTLDPVTLTNGDATPSNEVDFDDFNAVVAAFGALPGDPNWDDNCDLDGTREVDFDDFNLVVARFGEIGDF